MKVILPAGIIWVPYLFIGDEIITYSPSYMYNCLFSSFKLNPKNIFYSVNFCLNKLLIVQL